MAETPVRLSAVSIGPVAARILREGARGRVGAVFERSFYVNFGEAWICVGTRGLGDGPLNVLCADGRATPGRSKAHAPDDVAIVKDRSLWVGDALAVNLHAAAPWFPPLPAPIGHKSLAAGLHALQAALPSELPVDGLALLLRPPGAPSPWAENLSSTPRQSLGDEKLWPSVTFAALGPMQYLRQQVRLASSGHLFHADADQLGPLIGLGPGLTPSGDDFLGGALVALTLIGMHVLRDVVWNALRSRLPTHTTAISAAHLAASAEGVGSAALHDLLNAIVENRDDIPRRLAVVAAIGHTSGWDALAGAVAALSAYADAQR
jgi:hypothetical protein